MENHGNYQPSKQVLSQELTALRNDTVYVNHAGFLAEGPRDLMWMNIIREPIARWSSLFYYAVDGGLRAAHAAKALRVRERDVRCGCARLEFDECIKVKHARKCTIIIPSQTQFFCEPSPSPSPAACNRSITIANVRFESQVCFGWSH